MPVDYIIQNWSVEERRARKLHHCCECRGEIQPGYRYNLGRGVGDEGWESWRFHLTCWEIREACAAALLKAGVEWEDHPAFGELVERSCEEAHEMDDFPDWWPRGVWFSAKRLAEHVAAKEVR